MSTQSHAPDEPTEPASLPPATQPPATEASADTRRVGGERQDEASHAEGGPAVDARAEATRRALKLTQAPSAAMAEKLLGAVTRSRPERLEPSAVEEEAERRLAERAADERARRRQDRLHGQAPSPHAEPTPGGPEPRRHDDAPQRRGSPAGAAPRAAVSIPDGHPLGELPLGELTFAVLDFETTGLYAGAAEILEVGIYEVHGGRITPSYASLVRPRGRVPAEITALTGIDFEMVRDAPSIEEVLDPLEEALAGRVLVAHNAAFDRSFLDRALVDHGRLPFAGPVLCTQRLARRVRTDLLRRSLDALCEAYGLPNTARHRARGDAEVTARLLVEFLELARDLGARTLRELAALCSEKPQGGVDFSRYAFGPARLAHLPHAPGVYRMLARDGEVIYVGKARDLHQRVGSYFTGRAKGKLAAIREALHDLELVPCDSELEAILLESAEIHRLRPRLNVQVNVKRRGFWLKVSRRGSGPARIVSASAPGDGLFGPFVDGAGGREVAKRLRLAFDLAGSPAFRQTPPEAFLARAEGAAVLVHALELALSRCAPTAEVKRAEELRQSMRTVRRIAASRAAAGTAHHRRDLVVRLHATAGLKLFLLRDGSPLRPLQVVGETLEAQLENLQATLLRILDEAPQTDPEAESAHDGHLLLDAWLERHPPSARLDLGEALASGHLREQLAALLGAAPPPNVTELL